METPVIWFSRKGDYDLPPEATGVRPRFHALKAKVSGDGLEGSAVTGAPGAVTYVAVCGFRLRSLPLIRDDVDFKTEVRASYRRCTKCDERLKEREHREARRRARLEAAEAAEASATLV